MRKMKDSGIAWIGEIPEEWNVGRLKYQFSFGKGLSITKADLIEDGIGVISYGQVHAKYNTGTSLCDELIRYIPRTCATIKEDSLVHKGDFIFADTSEDYEGCGNCVYVDKEQNLYAGYHTIILKNKIADGKYFSYLFKTDFWREQIRARVSGVKVFSISQKILSDAVNIIPPLDEQHRIAAYLDEKCVHIDAVIEKTRASIDEYKKLKQAIITRAVTKGLRQGRKMKDSGIAWIGEIPEEWSRVRLKYLASHNDDSLEETTDYNFSFDYIDISSVEYGKGITQFQPMIFKDAPSRARRVVKTNDVILSTVRTYLKAVATISPHEKSLVVSTGFIVLRAKERKLTPRFLHYAILSDAFISLIEAHSVGIGYPAINASDVVNLAIPVPSLPEQQEIAAYLDAKTAAIDRLIAKKEQIIAEMQSCKKSLIYEVVTGKREAAI